MSFSVETSDDFNLDDPEVFAEAAKDVAKITADSLGDDFARTVDGVVYVNAEVLSLISQAEVINGIEAGVLGETEVAITFFKSAVANNALFEEAKARA